jgi:hypothetical protein
MTSRALVTAHLYRANKQQYVFNIDDAPEELTKKYIAELQLYFAKAYPNHKTYLRITNNV